MAFYEAIDQGRSLNKGIMSPYDIGTRLRQTIIFCAALFITFTIPFQICFLKHISIVLIRVTILANVALLIDVVATYVCTSYVDESSKRLIDDHNIIWEKSRKSPLFYLDFSSTIIFFTYLIVLKWRPYLFIIAPFLFLRAITIGAFFKRMEGWLVLTEFFLAFRNFFVVLRIVKIVWATIYWIHCMGCLFNYMADSHDNGHTWRTTVESQNKSLVGKYISAFYWAVTTTTRVGFGDVHVVNRVEMVFCIVVMLMNFIGFSAYISSLVNNVATSVVVERATTRGEENAAGGRGDQLLKMKKMQQEVREEDQLMQQEVREEDQLLKMKKMQQEVREEEMQLQTGAKFFLMQRKLVVKKKFGRQPRESVLVLGG